MVGPCSLFDYSNQTITVGDNLKLNTLGPIIGKELLWFDSCK